MRWRLGVGNRRSRGRDTGSCLQGLDLRAQLRIVLLRPGAGCLVGRSANVLDQPALRQVRRPGDQGLHALILQPGAGGGEFRHLGTQGGRHGDRDGRELLQVLHRIGHAGAERALIKPSRIVALLHELADRSGKGRVCQGQLALGHNLVQLRDHLAQRVTLRSFAGCSGGCLQRWRRRWGNGPIGHEKALLVGGWSGSAAHCAAICGVGRGGAAFRLAVAMAASWAAATAALCCAIR